MTSTHRRPRNVILAATAIACSIAGALVATAAGSAQSDGARTITVFETAKGSTFGFVDNPPKTTRKDPHASVGDILAFSNALVDRSRTQRLGSASAQCVATRPGRVGGATYVCFGSFALPDGTLAVAALQHGEPKTQQLAIVGGTGAYDGARGTILARSLKAGTEDTITLLP
jgi:hypothetical protein